MFATTGGLADTRIPWPAISGMGCRSWEQPSWSFYYDLQRSNPLPAHHSQPTHKLEDMNSLTEWPASRHSKHTTAAPMVNGMLFDNEFSLIFFNSINQPLLSCKTARPTGHYVPPPSSLPAPKLYAFPHSYTVTRTLTHHFVFIYSILNWCIHISGPAIVFVHMSGTLEVPRTAENSTVQERIGPDTLSST